MSGCVKLSITDFLLNLSVSKACNSSHFNKHSLWSCCGPGTLLDLSGPINGCLIPEP